MKHSILAVILMMASLNCASQILNIQTIGLDQETSQPGIYYKDLEHKLDSYVGSWKYQNGSTILTMKILKREHYYNDARNCYEDIIYGDYQYIENGITVVDRISLLDNLNLDPINDFSISGDVFLHNNCKPLCIECDEFIPRIFIDFIDKERDYIFTKSYFGIMEASPENKLVFNLIDMGGATSDFNAPMDIRPPADKYILSRF